MATTITETLGEQIARELKQKATEFFGRDRASKLREKAESARQQADAAEQEAADIVSRWNNMYSELERRKQMLTEWDHSLEIVSATTEDNGSELSFYSLARQHPEQSVRWNAVKQLAVAHLEFKFAIMFRDEASERLKSHIETMRQFGRENGVPESHWPPTI